MVFWLYCYSIVTVVAFVPALRRNAAVDCADIDRIAATAHIVIARANPSHLGYVKLNRILWHADLEHYRWHGVSITGLRHYLRTLQGPMRPEILQSVGCLARAGRVAERVVNIADYMRREMISLAAPDLSSFTDEQVGIVTETVRMIAPLTATQLRQMTEDDPLWREVPKDAAMSIATASIMSQRVLAG